MTTETETRPVPAEPTTPIKPSEAIRLGCLIAPVQAFGHYSQGEGSACAMGAMLMAYGESPYGDDFKDPAVDAALTSMMYLPCPEGCADEAFSQNTTAVHLNDDHRWPRERIADWLEGRGL